MGDCPVTAVLRGHRLEFGRYSDMAPNHRPNPTKIVQKLHAERHKGDRYSDLRTWVGKGLLGLILAQIWHVTVSSERSRPSRRAWLHYYQRTQAACKTHDCLCCCCCCLIYSLLYFRIMTSYPTGTRRGRHQGGIDVRRPDVIQYTHPRTCKQKQNQKRPEASTPT